MASLPLRALALAAGLAAASAQDDGNPHGWDRLRRCDHAGYSPKCGPCEGIGGIVRSDAKDDIDIPGCALAKAAKDIDPSTLKRPVWGASFTETMSHEILIGKKTDPACFQAFPGNQSIGTNCYKPQDCKIVVDFKEKNAMKLVCDQAGNAWGLVGRIKSTIYHQGQHMWITNNLPLSVTQTICTGPREGGDKSKPPIYPVQYNWVDNLFFLARERLDVEYGVGTRELDHWAFGPHHAWTEPATGLIVRMWQPFNGLQIFAPGTFSASHDPAEFAELTADGKTAPAHARKGGSTFRIKCTDDGFPEGDPHPVAAAPGARASAADLQRARTRTPRAAFRGDGFERMSRVLNGHLRRSGHPTRECELWAAEELQQFQLLMMALREPSLDGVYHNVSDNRRLRGDVEAMAASWERLNAVARGDPQLASVHRDGHCHEAVMWYVHHLSQETREALRGKLTLPLLSYRRHEGSSEVHRAYEEKVTCFSCHSNALPSAAPAEALHV